jgi:hypothetical protein
VPGLDTETAKHSGHSKKKGELKWIIKEAKKMTKVVTKLGAVSKLCHLKIGHIDVLYNFQRLSIYEIVSYLKME